LPYWERIKKMEKTASILKFDEATSPKILFFIFPNQKAEKREKERSDVSTQETRVRDQKAGDRRQETENRGRETGK